MSRQPAYLLRGRWPGGAITEARYPLADCRELAVNWARAGADVTISINATVVEHHEPKEA